MASLRTDSPISRRIVLAFLDFLHSVEPAPGVDCEGLEVVRECLEEVFKLHPTADDDQRRPRLLVDLFSSSDDDEDHSVKLDSCPAGVQAQGPSSSTVQNFANGSLSEASKSLNEKSIGDTQISGFSRDELFSQLFVALEKINFFKPTADGNDDHTQLDRVKQLFDEALLELEESGCQTLNSSNLAEALKTKGNQAMKLKLYSNAVELYTCAIALCDNNSVYYCNRAAAYTQLQKYTEAIADCNRSIEINPNYGKAYSRLGFAYYEQGKYSDAIDKGFLKALQLDPDSSSIRENIRAAQQKMRDEQTERDQNAWRGGSQNANDRSNAPNSNQGAAAFTSMPFTSPLRPDFGHIFMDVGQDSNNPNGPDEPDFTIGGSMSFTFRGDEVDITTGQQVQDLMGAWRSMMDMYPPPSPPPPEQGGTQGDRQP